MSFFISFTIILFSIIIPTPSGPVQTQLAVFLYRMGRYGNGASIKDLACISGMLKD